jgi:hypothetical protein
VLATLLAGFASNAVFADEMLAPEGGLRSMLALLEKWCRWPGPPNHAWNRRVPMFIHFWLDLMSTLFFPPHFSSLHGVTRVELLGFLNSFSFGC